MQRFTSIEKFIFPNINLLTYLIKTLYKLIAHMIDGTRFLLLLKLSYKIKMDESLANQMAHFEIH